MLPNAVFMLYFFIISAKKNEKKQSSAPLRLTDPTGLRSNARCRGVYCGSGTGKQRGKKSIGVDMQHCIKTVTSQREERDAQKGGA